MREVKCCVQEGLAKSTVPSLNVLQCLLERGSQQLCASVCLRVDKYLPTAKAVN